MKEIDHDERERPKVPYYQKWVEKDYPNGATPMDLFYYMAPIAAVFIGLYLWRGY